MGGLSAVGRISATIIRINENGYPGYSGLSRIPGTVAERANAVDGVRTCSFYRPGLCGDVWEPLKHCLAETGSACSYYRPCRYCSCRIALLPPGLCAIWFGMHCTTIHLHRSMMWMLSILMRPVSPEIMTGKALN